MKNDGFVVLEYIRSSIEIIMSLKIEELDSSQKNQSQKKMLKHSH